MQTFGTLVFVGLTLLLLSPKAAGSIVWKKDYLLEGCDHFESELRDTLEKSLTFLLSEYFANSGRREKKPTFYFFFN